MTTLRRAAITAKSLLQKTRSASQDRFTQRSRETCTRAQPAKRPAKARSIFHWIPKERIALLPIIDSCVTSVSAAAWARAVDIKIDVSPNVSRHVRGDEALIRELLCFILNDAIACRSETKIRLIIERNEQRGMDHVRFIVADRQQPPSQYAQERLFLRFDNEPRDSVEFRSAVHPASRLSRDMRHSECVLGKYPTAEMPPIPFFSLRLPSAVKGAASIDDILM